MTTDQPTEPANHQTDQPRGGDGRYTTSLETAERDAEAARLRLRGWSYRRIATEMGYAAHTSARDAVLRCVSAVRGELADDVRQIELERLDAMYEAVMKVLERDHVTVSQGRIVRARVLDDNGDPIIVGRDKDDKPVYREEEVLDDGPVLAAVGRLLDIQKRRAALLGLDAPTRAEVGGTLSYEIVGVDLGQL